MINVEEKHEILLKAQNAHLPILTLEQMGVALGIKSGSHGHVTYILDRLVEAGLAEKIRRGSKHVYRIVDPQYRHNEGRRE